MSEDFARLIDKARKGDVAAFAEVFEGMRQMVFAVACRVVGPDDAEDVTMEAYLKAWQALPRFKGRSSLKTWLYRVTYNCSLDTLRARGRRKETSLVQGEDDRTADIADTSQPVPDEAVVRSETVKEIQLAMDRLSDDHRTALLLRYSNDLSYSDIAAATGVSIGTVMSRLFHAKRRLRRILEA